MPFFPEYRPTRPEPAGAGMARQDEMTTWNRRKAARHRSLTRQTEGVIALSAVEGLEVTACGPTGSTVCPWHRRAGPGPAGRRDRVRAGGRFRVTVTGLLVSDH
jgi:hypothetical protein